MIDYANFLKKMTDKLSWVTDEVDFLYPYIPRNGKYATEKPHLYSWITGFYGGILWQMYRLTGEEKYLKLGKESAKRFDGALDEFNSLSHDVGFQFLPTCVADYIETGDRDSLKRSIHAATILAGRYNPRGEFIRAWNDNPAIGGDSPKTGYVIIDCMMNIPLLYWATEVTGDPRYAQIANLHADTVIKNFVRDDGSVCHIVVFDPETGEAVEKPEGQGYAPGSTWTRGQGWAIYGFAMAYHYTKNPKYLQVAKAAAENFAAKVKEDYIPIDFDQPLTPAYEDSSAGAIAVCGMLEIMNYTDGEEKKFYSDAVDKIMEILYSKCDFSHDTEAVLLHCSEMYHREASRDVSLIYGDFYLLEALARIAGDKPVFYSK